ncbi:hypothetical protein [Agrobacterium sp. a22-2]|uniref:hypothetical protein n=1 Tax=Agrobacterium sp. a22-2 TaxID=2283840 RepID=UPI001AEDD8D2|nr:hypothetical protein [Agrobacterium sp. a22-2]
MGFPPDCATGIALWGLRQAGVALFRQGLGTLIYFVLREMLSGFGAGYMIVLGSVAIVVMMFSKKGLWHLLETRLGWVLFPTIRHP